MAKSFLYGAISVLGLGAAASCSKMSTVNNCPFNYTNTRFYDLDKSEQKFDYFVHETDLLPNNKSMKDIHDVNFNIGETKCLIKDIEVIKDFAITGRLIKEAPSGQIDSAEVCLPSIRAKRGSNYFKVKLNKYEDGVKDNGNPDVYYVLQDKAGGFITAYFDKANVSQNWDFEPIIKGNKSITVTDKEGNKKTFDNIVCKDHSGNVIQ